MAQEKKEERTVIVAMDGSDYSTYAFNWYMDNVHRRSDHVVLLHCPEFHAIVASSLSGVEACAVADMWQEEEKRMNEFVDELGQMLKNKKIGGKVICRRGRPGETIIEVAKEINASMIITGSRGLGKIRRTFLGSVSDYVLHHTKIPMMIARRERNATSPESNSS